MLFFGRLYQSFSIRFSYLRLFYLLPLLIIFLITSNAFSGDISLEWDPNIEPNLAGYKMYYGTSSSSYTCTIDVGNHTTCTISDLEEGNIYYFAATAYDLFGNESDYSNEAFKYIPKIDTDEDGISDDDEIDIYGLDPNNSDTDNDGISDGNEVDFWGNCWNDDSDWDGIVNLLDWDSDDDGFPDGWEKDHNSDPSDSYSTPPLPPMEIGEISIDHKWTTVHMQYPFIDPIVIAKPLSLNEDDPAVVRIRNVEPGSFEICLQEWEYLDGVHAQEMVSFLIVERGSYILEDSTRVEAGTFETGKTKGFETVRFHKPFETEPVVMGAVISFDESDTVTGRIRRITTRGFQYRLQEQERNSQVHAMETISYIAWEPSSGTIDGLAFKINRTADVVRHAFHTISFDQEFMSIPMFFADMQTMAGSNTANVRWQNNDVFGVDVQIDEEQSRDKETNHTTEVVGYMLFAYINLEADNDSDGLSNGDEINIYGTNPNMSDTDGDGLSDGYEIDFWGHAWDSDYDMDGLINLLDMDSDGDGFVDGVEAQEGFDPGDPGSRPALVEIGEIDLDNNWKHVTFSRIFFDPVVVAKPISTNEDDPAVVRIRNVDGQGFEVCIQEWNHFDAIHAEETVSYIVMERGCYRLEDGVLIEAGRFETNRTRSFRVVPLNQAFTVTPVLIAAVTSFNKSDTVTGRIRRITTRGFHYRLQKQKRNSQVHATETISYIAWEPSSGTLAGLDMGSTIEDTK